MQPAQTESQQKRDSGPKPSPAVHRAGAGTPAAVGPCWRIFNIHYEIVLGMQFQSLQPWTVSCSRCQWLSAHVPSSWNRYGGKGVVALLSDISSVFVKRQRSLGSPDAGCTAEDTANRLRAQLEPLGCTEASLPQCALSIDPSHLPSLEMGISGIAWVGR